MYSVRNCWEYNYVLDIDEGQLVLNMCVRACWYVCVRHKILSNFCRYYTLVKVVGWESRYKEHSFLAGSWVWLPRVKNWIGSRIKTSVCLCVCLFAGYKSQFSGIILFGTWEKTHFLFCFSGHISGHFRAFSSLSFVNHTDEFTTFILAQRVSMSVSRGDFNDFWSFGFLPLLWHRDLIFWYAGSMWQKNIGKTSTTPPSCEGNRSCSCISILWKCNSRKDPKVTTETILNQNNCFLVVYVVFYHISDNAMYYHWKSKFCRSINSEPLGGIWI